MARIEDATDATRITAVEPGIGALRVAIASRGYGFSVGAQSGTVAAALGAGSAVFLLRSSAGAGRRIFLERLRIEFACLAAFTTPITAGRALALYRGASITASSGGTTLAPVNKHTTSDISVVSTTNSGDLRIATTGALTATGAVWEATPLALTSLVHVGNAGGYKEEIYELGGASAQPIQIDPGQALAIRNPNAMDAAGTWQLAVTAHWYEAPAIDYTG